MDVIPINRSMVYSTDGAVYCGHKHNKLLWLDNVNKDLLWLKLTDWLVTMKDIHNLSSK